MTPQEQGMLDGLIGRVQNTQLAGKDVEAEQRIQQALGSNPDALYVLCQTVLVQGYALEQATQQLAASKQQLSQAQANAGNHPGFLEKIFGSSQPTPVQPAPATQASYGAPVYSTPAYPPPGYPPQGYPQQYPPQGYGAPMGGGGFGGGGFLQGALQTAAGVAMGEIAVQSLEGLMRGFGREAGYGSDRAMGSFDGGRDFADNSGSAADLGSGDSYGDRLANSDGANDGLSSDIEDRRGDARGFMGGDDTGTNGSDAFADDGGDSGDAQQDDSYDSGDSGDSGGGNDDSY